MAWGLLGNLTMNSVSLPNHAELGLDNLTVSYQRRPAIHHLSGRFTLGSSNAIYGPNGAGKSTVLKALLGLVRPDHGTVMCHGIRTADIAYLPQASDIDRSLPITVADLVLTGLWQRIGMFRAAGKTGRQRVSAALTTVGLSGFEHRPIYQLSGGQFQRVLFARILVQDAKVILLDEPFNSIDAKTTEELLALIHQWVLEQRTVIAVLHDEQQVRNHFQHTLLLAREMIAWGPTHKVLTPTHLQRARMNVAVWDEAPPVCHRDDAVVTAS